MAVTSLWHIQGSLKDLISYVENPEKTVPKGTEDFFNVFSYMQRSDKTKDQYVTAINCLKDTAMQQMILTKQRFGKKDKYIAWHGYQSFQIGEVTPDTAHEIGVKLAKEMWGDQFQIVVTTHLDKEHIHNHFAFNSVSFRDGRKYNYSKSEQQRLRDTSDRLCMEYQLSVIRHPHKAPSRPVWLDEKEGKPTRYNIYRADIQAALDGSMTVQYFQEYLQRMGYITDFTGKHWKIRLPQYEHFTRLDTLNESWTPENIREDIYGAREYCYRKPVISFSPFMPAGYRNYYTPHRPTSHIYKLYLYYCYQIGVLPKRTEYRPTSPQLKAALRQLDEITAQVDYMAQFGVQTMEDLMADRANLEQQMNLLIAKRTKLQNKIRRATPEEKEALRSEKATVTEQIQQYRQWLKCNHGIEKRSVQIQDTLDRVYDNELRIQKQRNRERSYER